MTKRQPPTVRSCACGCGEEFVPSNGNHRYHPSCTRYARRQRDLGRFGPIQPAKPNTVDEFNTAAKERLAAYTLAELRAYVQGRLESMTDPRNVILRAAVRRALRESAPPPR